MSYKVGDLVKWHEPYTDGFIKDAGIGIIIRSFSYDFFDKPTKIYEVYRNKKQDKMRFEEHELEMIDEKD